MLEGANVGNAGRERLDIDFVQVREFLRFLDIPAFLFHDCDAPLHGGKVIKIAEVAVDQRGILSLKAVRIRPRPILPPGVRHHALDFRLARIVACRGRLARRLGFEQFGVPILHRRIVPVRAALRVGNRGFDIRDFVAHRPTGSTTRASSSLPAASRFARLRARSTPSAFRWTA